MANRKRIAPELLTRIKQLRLSGHSCRQIFLQLNPQISYTWIKHLCRNLEAGIPEKWRLVASYPTEMSCTQIAESLRSEGLMITAPGVRYIKRQLLERGSPPLPPPSDVQTKFLEPIPPSVSSNNGEDSIPDLIDHETIEALQMKQMYQQISNSNQPK